MDSVCRCPSCLYEHQNIICRPEDVFGFFKPGNVLLKYGTLHIDLCLEFIDHKTRRFMVFGYKQL